MDELEIKGKKYISSKRASELTSYAKDYVGQLVRAGKLPATRVGRAWYVEQEALVAYHARENAGATAPVAETTSRIAKNAPRKGFTPATIKALGYVPKSLPGTWSSVSYSFEEDALFPTPKASIPAPLPAISEEMSEESHPVMLKKLETPIRIKILEERVAKTAEKIRDKRQIRSPFDYPVLPLAALTAALAVVFFFSSGFSVFSEATITNQGASAATVYSGFHYAADLVVNSGPFQAGWGSLSKFFALLFTYFFSFLHQGWDAIMSVFQSIF